MRCHADCLRAAAKLGAPSVGANDGIIGSNSYMFEQIGWKGVRIEPQPDIFRLKLSRIAYNSCF
jgi:hypothetical protein